MGRLPPAPLVRYGEHPDQVANLHLPAGSPPFSVVVLLHGGFWRARWDRTLMTPLGVDLALHGYAAWNVEFRRVGGGGGWPLTLEDVRSAIAALASVPEVDSTRVALVGHSSGGHLALTAADSRVDVAGVFALAAIYDIERARELDATAVSDFLGGTAEAERTSPAEASPRSLLPLGVRQVLVHGEADEVVPPAWCTEYADAARAAGDDVDLVLVPGVDHFDVIDPGHRAWRAVTDRLSAVFGTAAGGQVVYQ